jgi:hypothetical protein
MMPALDDQLHAGLLCNDARVLEDRSRSASVDAGLAFQGVAPASLKNTSLIYTRRLSASMPDRTRPVCSYDGRLAEM